MSVSFDNIRLRGQYSRPDLSSLWGYKGYEAISRGIVTPAKTNFIILFITKEKQAFLTQYADAFEGGLLEMEGETNHAADNRLVSSIEDGSEIHLFYRDKHHTDFTYEGRVWLSDYLINTDKPSRFRFAVDRISAAVMGALETETQAHGIVEGDFVPDEEGRKRIVQHIIYERSAKNRARAIEVHGTKCLACGFDFNETYGTTYARDYIEVHHVQSITKQEGKPVNPETDLAPLCSNCHSMAHRERGKILGIVDLQRLLSRK
jgi:5-methylcytosine-specific restriction protein A